jgi:hypothetical protein
LELIMVVCARGVHESCNLRPPAGRRHGAPVGATARRDARREATEREGPAPCQRKVAICSRVFFVSTGTCASPAG